MSLPLCEVLHSVAGLKCSSVRAEKAPTDKINNKNDFVVISEVVCMKSLFLLRKHSYHTKYVGFL